MEVDTTQCAVQCSGVLYGNGQESTVQCLKTFDTAPHITSQYTKETTEQTAIQLIQFNRTSVYIHLDLGFAIPHLTDCRLSSTCSHSTTLICTFVCSIQDIRQRSVVRTYVLTYTTHTCLVTHSVQNTTQHNSPQSIVQFASSNTPYHITNKKNSTTNRMSKTTYKYIKIKFLADQ